MSRSGANLNLPAAGEGERARSLRYEGEWDSNLMHGKGVMEYFNEDVSLMVGDFPTARRRFEGTFRKGFPIEGSLRNGNGRMCFLRECDALRIPSLLHAQTSQSSLT
jgi:hypothetical protein